MLMWRPSDGLHCSVVVAELDDWRCGVEVPDVELIVIAATGDFPIVWRPFQATYLQGRCSPGQCCIVYDCCTQPWLVWFSV